MATPDTHRRIVLAARPHGRPAASDFRLETVPAPVLAEGQVLLRTQWLSLDPYMRNLMEEPGPGYAPPIALGATMPGGTVNRVLASRNGRIAVGDVVLANAGWQELAVSDGSDLLPVGDPARPSLALGALGMPGFTAWLGLLDIGQPRPGETVVVAAATGAVGAIVGQIAKLQGARVVGIAGGADKCAWAIEELGFDACLDRRAPDLAQRLAQACPDGIDVYFENVGGQVLDAVLPLLNLNARVPVCGFVSHYNGRGDEGSRARLLATVLARRVRLEGFIILDHYATRLDAFRRQMAGWIADGLVRVREDRVDGLENAPAALAGLLEGRNFGKLVVRLAE
jgi:NADPH-dependent curcumin reductase CurA